MYIYDVLFNCKIQNYSSFILNQIFLKKLSHDTHGITDIHHIGTADDLIVHLVSHKFEVFHFLVYRVNASQNGYLICIFLLHN